MTDNIFDLMGESPTQGKAKKEYSDMTKDEIQSFLSGYTMVKKDDFQTRIKPGMMLAYRRVEHEGKSKFVKGGKVLWSKNGYVGVQLEGGKTYSVGFDKIDVAWVLENVSNSDLVSRVAALEQDVVRLTMLIHKMAEKHK